MSVQRRGRVVTGAAAVYCRDRRPLTQTGRPRAPGACWRSLFDTPQVGNAAHSLRAKPVFRRQTSKINAATVRSPTHHSVCVCVCVCVF